MHRTRPVRHRGSAGPAGWPPIRYSSHLPGSCVIRRSRCQVTVSVSPVLGSPRLPWNPLTAFSVRSSYVPVGPSKSHSAWRSRACSSRTPPPLSPRDHRTADPAADRDAPGFSPAPSPVLSPVSSPASPPGLPSDLPSDFPAPGAGALLLGSSMCTGECVFPSVPCTVQPHTVTRAANAAPAANDLPMPVLRTTTPLLLTGTPVCHLRCCPRMTARERRGMVVRGPGDRCEQGPGVPL